ncbi:hypothetical protein BJ508DRAFT_333371 [Ascobolus immersus RN42]|uniref:Uncharacterized protein n=1 Tax=Ascobolus immersus RN42 TaxID=1160509 RepID=A0A3N4HJW6_ASCIM|nr:hypothetical protein BJ508DRAFT_333371 [Ascobolus immersus RN42]
MVSSKAPAPSQWDDEDYGQKLRVFCGKRRLPGTYIHISQTNIERMFAPNPDPEVSRHGVMGTRYQNYVDDNTAYGPDENEKYHATDPEKYPDDGEDRGKTMAQIKREAFKLCLVVTAEDDAFLHAVAKNLLASRIRLSEIKAAEYIVKDALGIDVNHPHYERCKFSAVKNRDTWQNRTLDAAFDVCCLIYNSDWGKANLQPKFKGFGYFVYDAAGNKKRWLFPIDLIEDRIFNLDTAKKVFYVCLEAIDLTALSKSNGKPTAFGKALMYKAMAIIQFEMVYLIAKWTNKITGVFEKQSHHKHSRDLLDYFPYLLEMDELYLNKCTIQSSDARGTADIVVARLYPMDRTKSYGKVRQKKKHFDMNHTCDNQFKMGDLNDDSD